LNSILGAEEGRRKKGRREEGKKGRREEGKEGVLEFQLLYQSTMTSKLSHSVLSGHSAWVSFFALVSLTPDLLNTLHGA